MTHIREDLKQILYHIERKCDGPFIQFLSDNWDVIKNPEKIVRLIEANEDQIISDGTPLDEMDLDLYHTCAKAFIWEYEVEVPLNLRGYKLMYTCRRYDPPRRELETTLTSIRFNSYKFQEDYKQMIRILQKQTGNSLRITLFNDIKVKMKMTGNWDSLGFPRFPVIL